MPVARNLPASTADGSGAASPTRTGPYGEAYVMAPTYKESADEGSYYVAVTGTPRTGIIGHAAPTTFDETKAYLTVYNGGVKNLELKSISLLDTVISVGDTQMGFTLTYDTGNLVTSGGTAMTVSNTNSGSTNKATGVIITCGAVVCAAATSARAILGDYVFRGANVDVVWDQYEFCFGGVTSTPPTTPTPTTLAAHFTRNLFPVVIAPGFMFKLHQWAGSQSTGPTFQTIVGFTYR